MKRYIRTSKFQKISTSDLTVHLFSALKQFLPKSCRFILNPRYDGMKIENCPDNKRVERAIIQSLTELGYDVKLLSNDSEFIDFAAIQGEAWANVGFTRVDWDNYVEVFVDGNKGNVIFEDWYEET